MNMESNPQKTRVFGWVILGVWAGILIGDYVAVAYLIWPGYVIQPTSAPTRLKSWLIGAAVGFCLALPIDLFIKKSPKPIYWKIWIIASVGYRFLIRFSYETAARE